MSQFASGVSGGVAVTGQTSGVTLSAVGDYAVLYVSNASPPGGPDVSVALTLSGSPVGANVTFTKKYVAAGTATNLTGITVNGTEVSSPYLVPGVDTDLSISGITGLYSITVTLNSITSGDVLVQGQSSPGSATGLDAAILAQVTVQTETMQAMLLALQDMIGTSSYQPNYLDAAGSID